MKQKVLLYGAVLLNATLMLWISIYADPALSLNNFWERAGHFLPQTVVILTLVILIQLVTAKLLPKRNDTTVSELIPGRQEFKKPIGLRILISSWLLILIGGPLLEELMFRLPLLLLFTRLNPASWTGIAVNALFFCLIHLPGFAFSRRVSDIMANPESGHLTVEELSAAARKPAPVSISKWVIRIVSAYVIGLVCGYIAVNFQSLWSSVLFHMLWNTAAVILLPALVGILGLLWVLLGLLKQLIFDR